MVRLTDDSALYHAVIHGAVNETVQLEDGAVPTVRKAISDLAGAIQTGFASGYVQAVANNAGRLAATPAQLGQLLIQLDTAHLYYATSLVMGSWVFHPVQNAASDANNAVNAVNTLTASLGTKMTTSGYVGANAGGVVRSAEMLHSVNLRATSHPKATLHVYGVETGAVGLFTASLPNGAGTLVDGVNKRTILSNTSRRCLARGTNFALVGAPKRLVSWGAQSSPGILGSGVSGTTAHFPRSVVARQQPDRPLPGFNPHVINSDDGEIVDVLSQGAATMVRTAGGLVLTCGGAGQGVAPLFGSGVDKAQNVLMPIFFDSGGTNMPIKLLDAVDDVSSTKHSTAIFVDDTENVWLVGTNPRNAGYGNAITGAQRTPVKLNAGFPSWDGKIIRKVRCDTTGGIYILFANGELWAGGGANTTGLLGTGATANVLNPLQVATGVTDFEVSGHGLATELALWILQGTTLRAAGFNGSGHFNKGNLVNRTSFVDVATDVNAVRIGGTGQLTVMWRLTNGAWYACGVNTDGIFGENTTASKVSTAVLLVNLTTLIQDNGGLVDLCISGIAGKHAACVVCTNGLAFCAGNNTDGCLANGDTLDAKVWTRVNWSPLDEYEKIVDVSSAVGPSGGPAFTWRTSYGRVLQAGSATSGFSTGIAPHATYNMLSAAPVQLSVIL
jgi:hypothetical protein